MEERKEEEKKEEEIRGLKLKRGILVGKSRGGVCTPPPTWTFQPHFPHTLQQEEEEAEDKAYAHKDTFNNASASVTARQLGANLWEILPHLKTIANMNRHHHKGNVVGGFSKSRQSQGFEIRKVVEDPPDDDHIPSDEQPVSTGSFHRQIAASVMRHHQVVDRNGRALQPVSPASYTSSMEVTAYNPASTPSSSVEHRGRMGDPSYSLKTSTELLKVLNRIWCLEEQHASNISVTKALKTELNDARKRIKELLHEKQRDKLVMDEMMKQVDEHKLVRKNMEQDRLQSALQSVRQELQDERKLRKRSESLHRKMAREISEMKSSLSNALNELDRERRARILLEDLCDEFAMGIRDYEHELRSVQYRSDKEQVPKEDVDTLILHISEAWLDERVQMKFAEEVRKDMVENSMVVDKLRPEIETFLKAKQALDSRENLELPTKSTKGSGLRRQSLESYPLNEATSAPKNTADGDAGSTDSESNCFELDKNLGGDHSNGIHTKNVDNPEERGIRKTVKMNNAQRIGEPQEVTDGRSLTGLQTRFEKHMARMILRDGKFQKEGAIPDASHKSADREALEEESILERRSRRFGNRGNSNHLLDNLLRNNSSSNEGDRIHPVSDLPDDAHSHGHFLLAGPASPVKKWEPRIASQDLEPSESSSRWPSRLKDNTLKARLLEARLEGRHLQSKGSRGSA